MLTASAQKYRGKLYSWSIILAISTRVLFFLSTIPFYLGVLGEENVCKIPFSLQKVLNNSFLNLIPWSLLIEEIQKYFSFWTLFEKFSKVLKALFLWVRKHNQVNLE